MNNIIFVLGLCVKRAQIVVDSNVRMMSIFRRNVLIILNVDIKQVFFFEIL